jgi:CspA family cold shock protein
MATGVVKSFDVNKGWGFITPDDGEADVYVHFSQVRTSTLKQGDRVEFELGTGVRPQATAVKREGEEDPPEEDPDKEKPSFA